MLTLGPGHLRGHAGGGCHLHTTELASALTEGVYWRSLYIPFCGLSELV